MVWPFWVGVELMVGVSPTDDCAFWRRHQAHTAHSAGDSTGAVGESVASRARPTHANTFDTTSVPADAGAAGALAAAGIACGAAKACCSESVGGAVSAGGGGAARWTAASVTTDRVGGGPCGGDAALLAAADGVSATPPGRAVACNDHRFGFWGVGAVDGESVPDLLTGVVSLGVVGGLGVPVAGAVVGPGPESSPAEESPVPNVDVCAPPVLSTFISPVESVEFFDSVDEESPDESLASVNDESPVESLDSMEDPAPDEVEPDVDVPDVDPDDESGDEFAVESGSAHATPGVFATAAPIPSATASAPTRPIYLA
jgi:hypothetical protein